MFAKYGPLSRLQGHGSSEATVHESVIGALNNGLCIESSVSYILRRCRRSKVELLEEYATNIRRWFPILDIQDLQDQLQPQPNATTTPASNMIWLALLLVATKPQHQKAFNLEELHPHFKNASAALQHRVGPDMDLVRVQALIGLYECGRGQAQRAHLTLSSAVSMASSLGTRGHDYSHGFSQAMLSLVILDRYVDSHSLSLSYNITNMYVHIKDDSSIDFRSFFTNLVSRLLRCQQVCAGLESARGTRGA